MFLGIAGLQAMGDDDSWPSFSDEFGLLPFAKGSEESDKCLSQDGNQFYDYDYSVDSVLHDLELDVDPAVENVSVEDCINTPAEEQFPYNPVLLGLKYDCMHRGCDAKGLTVGELGLHHRKTHGLAKYICQVCNAEFQTRGELGKHSRKVHQVRQYKCRQCTRKFPRKDELINHRAQDHHKSSRRSDGLSDIKIQFNNYMILRPGDRPYQCSICCQPFALPGYFYNHMQRVHSNLFIVQ